MGVAAVALPFATAVNALCSKEILALVGAVTGAEASTSAATGAPPAGGPASRGTDAVWAVSPAAVVVAAAGRPIPVTRPEDTATTTPPRPMVAAWSTTTALMLVAIPVRGVDGGRSAR
jgi:hypothetical protein